MSRNFIFTLIAVLVVSNIFFAVQSFKNGQLIKVETADAKERIETENVAEFLQLFVTKVLQAEGEVSFEDRLKLENAVRDINDPKILAQWQKFVDSENEDVAQRNLKLLLQMLVEKLNQAK